MANPNGRKGAAWETDVVAYLRIHGFPNAERRVTNGVKDRGDISGVPGVVIEAKNEKTIDLPRYLRELAVEVENDGADFGFVFVKARGKPVSQGYMVVSIEEGVEIIGALMGGAT